MFGIIEMIGDFFVMIIGMIIDSIAHLLYIINLLSAISIQLPLMIKFLPGPIVAIVTASLALAVVAKVLGRDG